MLNDNKQTDGEYKKIATIHKKGISTGFLSTLNTGFLSALYKAIAHSPYSTVISVGNTDGGIEGFISGAESTRKMYRWIVLHHGIQLSVHLLMYCLNAEILKKIIETLNYAKIIGKGARRCSFENSVCEAELLSVAVSEESRKNGYGSRLLHDLEHWFLIRKINQYKVVTYAYDSRSNSFYHKNNFSFVRTFVHHGNSMNEYLKKIDRCGR